MQGFNMTPVNSSYGQPPSPAMKGAPATGILGANPFFPSNTNTKQSISLQSPTTPSTKTKTGTTSQSPFFPGALSAPATTGGGFFGTPSTTTAFPTTTFPSSFPPPATNTNISNNVIVQQPKHALFNTRYNDLEAKKDIEGKEAAKMIRETYEKFKLPMKEGITELEKTKEISDLTLVEKELRKLRLVVLKLENDHIIQCKMVAELREESKEQFHYARRFGRSSLEQMKKRTGHYQGGMRGPHYGQLDNMTLDEIPNAFYMSALKKLEKRLALCTEDVRQFSLQLNVSIDNMSNHANTYGHRINVGPKQIVKILQHQNEMFGKVSSNIASLHKEVEIIKAEFLNRTGYNPNIFKGLTFEEKKSKEIMDKLLAKEAEDKSKQKATQPQQPQQQQQQQQQSALAFTNFSAPPQNQQAPFTLNFSAQQPSLGAGFGSKKSVDDITVNTKSKTKPKKNNI